MENIFLKISDLRTNANKKALLHYQQSSGTKVVKQIIGANPLNREWVDEASNRLKFAMQNQGFQRVKALTQALNTLYFCDWVLKENNYSDNEIKKMIQKAETTYLNACLSFIEQNVHQSNKVIGSFTTLFQAIEVISETNHSMAQKYKQMLSRYHSLYTTLIKIKDICNKPNNKLNKTNTQQISSLLTHHDSAFKMYPSLKEDILEIIKNKIDEILIDIQNETDKILSAHEPSLNELLKLLNEFYDIYSPLENIFIQKRYKEILEKRDEYFRLNSILNENYSEWVNIYQYYSLPRNKVDENKIINTLNSINKNSNLLNLNFIEINKLSPNPDEIYTFLQTLVSQQGNDSIIHYYKIENDLLNAPESEKKIEEIVRFIKHLEEKIAERNTKTQLKSELLRMKDDFNTILQNSIERKIIQYLATKPTQNNLIHFFDKILAYFYDMNDLNKISHWQTIKKTIFKALNEVPKIIEALKKDFDFMKQLPESKAKIALQKKIYDAINSLNDIMPTIALYQIGDIHNYLNTIDEIEKSMNFKESTLKPFDKLIILDKFTTKNIIIFGKDLIKIGRDEDANDIVLKSDWVSSSHCTLDFKNLLLTDNNSTNGTFVIDSKEPKNQFERKEKCAISEIECFNIANAFEIKIENFETLSIMKIVKIFDTDLLCKERDYTQGLFNTDFVWLKKYGSLAIDIFTGKVKLEEDNDKSKDIFVIMSDVGFIVVDKENSKPPISITEHEKITTDRFSIYLD
ncbi:MAG: FHA domain-containing protein [Candidatus Cloacimonetes bacterium]|nr:FHA domain-containing protein [Candidatus Cloacimonadota bacterium]